MGLDAYPKLVVGVPLESVASLKERVTEKTYYHQKTGKPYKMSEPETFVVFSGRELTWRQFLDALKLEKQNDDDDEETEGGHVPYAYHPDDDNGDGFTIHRTHSEGDWLNGYLGISMGRGDGGVERVGGSIEIDLEQAALFVGEVQKRLAAAGITEKARVYAFVYASY